MVTTGCQPTNVKPIDDALLNRGNDVCGNNVVDLGFIPLTYVMWTKVPREATNCQAVVN